MSAWLASFHSKLDQATRPLTFFFRDDDAGWADSKLFQLIDLFARNDMPLDLAVIPMDLRSELAASLMARRRDSPLGLHMHGFRHANHETVGRKCEFGKSRSLAEQFRDLEDGWRRLTDLLGEATDPIFTPPWNRCTQVTADSLPTLGFRALSRDRTASPLDSCELHELPIAVDFLRKRQGARVSLHNIGKMLADSVEPCSTVGVMLHHAVMRADDFHALEELLTLLRTHDKARVLTMRSLVEINRPYVESMTSAFADTAK